MRFEDLAIFEGLTESSPDDYGNVLNGTWVEKIQRYVHLREVLTKEQVKSGALQDVGAAVLRVRRDPDVEKITTADRVQVRGDIWAILAIAQVGPRIKGMIEFRVQKGIAP